MTHSKTQRRAIALQRTVRAWTLYTEHGATLEQIGCELQITRQGAAKALKRAELAGASELRGKATQQKARQLARLKALYRLALTSYHASVGDHTVRISTHKDTEDGTETTTRVQVVRKAGDAKHLDVARRALADIRKLLGLDAPTKIQQVDPERPDQGTSEEALRRELADIYAQAGLTGKKRSTEP